jgi:hypothetical protein
MLAGHYSTALIADQQLPKKGALLFLLVASQIQDFAWLVFALFGVEHTEPTDVLDATLSNMAVDMMFSHDLLPQIFWGVIVFFMGKMLFKSTAVGVAGLVLVIGHFVLDFFSGHPHHIFGMDSHTVGLGLYATNVYLAIAIEAVVIVVALWIFFRQEAKRNIKRTTKNKAAIIAVFVYGVLFLLFVATTSFREWFGIPELNLGFDTTVPTLLANYIGMIFILHYFVLRPEPQ